MQRKETQLTLVLAVKHSGIVCFSYMTSDGQVRRYYSLEAAVA